MKHHSILYGYVFPFTKAGIKVFRKALPLSIIPVVNTGLPACTYPCAQNGSRRILGTIWLLFRLYLPAALLFLLCNGAIWYDLGLVICYTSFFAMLLCLASSIVRMPMALAVVAAGGRVRDALKRGYVKRLISASFSRYLLLLTGVLPFALLLSFCKALPLVLYIAFTLLLTVYMWIFLGYGAGVCYKQAAKVLGKDKLPAAKPSRRARRVMSSILVFAVLLSAFPQSYGYASDGESDAVAEIKYHVEQIKKSFEWNITEGKIPYVTPAIESIKRGFNYASSGAKSGYDWVMKKLGYGAEIMPVISNVKDLVEAHEYNQQYVDESLSADERAKARNLMIYKAFSGLLPSSGPLKWVDKGLAMLDIIAEEYYGGVKGAYEGLFGGSENPPTPAAANDDHLSGTYELTTQGERGSVYLTLSIHGTKLTADFGNLYSASEGERFSGTYDPVTHTGKMTSPANDGSIVHMDIALIEGNPVSISAVLWNDTMSGSYSLKGKMAN